MTDRAPPGPSRATHRCRGQGGEGARGEGGREGPRRRLLDTRGRDPSRPASLVRKKPPRRRCRRAEPWGAWAKGGGNRSFRGARLLALCLVAHATAAEEEGKFMEFYRILDLLKLRERCKGK